jgi:hypothetical protein
MLPDSLIFWESWEATSKLYTLPTFPSPLKKSFNVFGLSLCSNIWMYLCLRERGNTISLTTNSSVLSQRSQDTLDFCPLCRARLESHGESFGNPVLLRFIASRWRYQESATSELECVVIVSDVKDGRLEEATRLKSKFKMVDVLSSFLNRDSYGKKMGFLNGNFPPHIRLVLIFDDEIRSQPICPWNQLAAMHQFNAEGV